MNDGIIAKRYAKALFKLGVENQRLDTYYSNLKSLQLIIKKDKNFRFLLDNPIIASTQKKKIFEKLFNNKVDNDIMSFLKFLITKNREVYLDDIIRSYIHMHNEYSNIQTVSLISAIEYDRETIDKIRTLIDKDTGKTSEFSTHINKELIGGFVLKIGDKQLDASVQGKLKSIKKQLLS